MHRPDRVAQSQIVDLESAMFQPASVVESSTIWDLHVNLEDGTQYEKVRTMKFDGSNLSDPHNISGNKNLSFGVAVDGKSLVSGEEEAEMINVTGNVNFRYGTDACRIMFFIGRAADTSSTPVVNKPTWLMPNFHLWYSTQFGAYIDKTLVVGDFGGADTDDTNPIVFGVAIMKATTGAVTNVNNLIGSLSIFRWSDDIVVHQPAP